MPIDKQLKESLIRDYAYKRGPQDYSPMDRIIQSEVSSDLYFGNAQQRATRAAEEAAMAALPKLDLNSALKDLVNFPGATGTLLPFEDDKAKQGKLLIAESLASKIEELKTEGINDTNIETFHNIWKEIKNYSTRAENSQKEIEDIRKGIGEDFSFFDLFYTSPTIAAKTASVFPQGSLSDPIKYQKAKDFVKDRTEEVSAISRAILKELNTLKTPYLGKKFLQQYVGTYMGEENTEKNQINKFNDIFNTKASWKDKDPLYTAMKEFAYDNANPGDDLYALNPSKLKELINKTDLSESERVTTKLLEDITLNSIATTVADAAKNAADVGDKESLELYKSTLKNINSRVSNSKKDYNIEDYGKWTRAINQLGIQAGRTLRSWADIALIGAYDYTPDAAHIGNDIKYGAVPVDLDGDGKMDVDKYGNMVMSNQFTYIKKNGSMGTNFGAIPELSATVIGQMAPILALDFFTRKGGSLLAEQATKAGAIGTIGKVAQSAGKFWETANAWKSARIADRAATFGLVTGAVYGQMYQDELRWTKDEKLAGKRAWGRSVIEGLTEALGAPEIGMFGIGRFPTSAKEGLLRMFSPKGATIPDRLKSFISAGAKVGVLAGKQTFTEAIEEEMSLYGNYLYGKILTAYDPDYGKKDEFQAVDIAQTFLDSFVGMAPYSLFGVGIQQARARKSAGIEHQVLWDMANNPDYYKAQIKDLVDKKRFTPEQAAQAIQTVNESKQVLDSIPNWENLKDMRTLLSDKDAQMKYFHDQLYRNKLVQINYDELDDAQKDALKNARLFSITKENAQKGLDYLASKETLTPKEEEQKAKLQGLLKLSDLSTHQFTSKEKQKLIELGVLKETDLTNSKEDLLKELESVDKSILKTKERVEQFINMSDEQKEATITKLFDEQVASVDKVNDPSILADSLAKTKEQLKFVEALPGKYQAEQTGRQRLVEALEEKLGEQIAIDPVTGRNNYTNSLLEEDVTGQSIIALQLKLSELQRNNKVVNETDYKELQIKYQKAQAAQVLEFSEMTPEAQDDFLVKFLQESAEVLPDYVFELDSLNKSLTLQVPIKDEAGNVTFQTVYSPDITEERFKKIQEKAFNKIVEDKKQAAAEAKDAEKTAGVEELPEDVEGGAFSDEEEKALTTKEVVDETGKTQTTNIEQLFNKLNRTKSGNATLSVDYFISKLINKTNEWFKEVKKATIPSTDFNRLTNFLRNTISGKYNSARILSEGKEIVESMPEELQEGVQGIINLAKYAGKYYQVNTKRRTIKGGKEAAEVKEEKPTKKEEEEDELAPEENTLLTQANAESAAQEKALIERQNAVIQLQIPSSTYGFEVTRGNKLSQDPAIIRNAEILRFLTTQDYGAFKVRITSRSNFLRQLAEAQGLTYEDFVALLNKAHEQYTAAKGSREKKAEAIQPILTELNNFFGEDFFEQTFEETEGRGIPELIYMVEKNGENLSDPILTIVNSEQAIQSFNGYPFYTNINSSPTILTSQDAANLPYWENILGERVSELEQFQPVVDAVVSLAAKIKANPTHFEDFPISRITQGTYIRETQQLVLLEKSEVEVTEEDVKVLKTPKQTLGTEVIAGVPGQAFVVVNGVPSVLFNDKVDPLEAEALAMMVFDKSLREQFFPGDDAAAEALSLKKHIDKVLNIFQKKGRKVAFVYDEKTQELIPFIPGVSGKQLTQEELTNLFKELFYNIKEYALDSMVPRFTVEDGEVKQTKKQSYLEFIKSTNKIYISENQPAVRRNQRIIFDMNIAPKPVKTGKLKLKTDPNDQKPAAKPPVTSAEKPKGKLKLRPEGKFETRPEEETEAALEALEKKTAETAAENLKAAILKNAKQAKLVEETNEDGTVDSYYLINGVRYERVSSEIPFSGDKASFGVKRSLKVGSAIDGILRDVFAGKTPNRPTIISPDAFKKIVSRAQQIYAALKDDYIVITEQMTVWNEAVKVAGTMDMVLIDKNTGKPLIVDFKTSAWIKQVKGKIMGYNSETGNMDLPMVSNPKEEYVTQQNSYGLMFLQQYGLMPELNIMYIQVTYAGKSSENVTFAEILTEEDMPIVDVPIDQTKVIPSLLPTTQVKPVLKEAAVAEEAPVSDKKAGIESFETAKGSVYTVLPDGRTQRFKTATGEQNEPNDLIVFVKFKNVQQEQDFLSAQNRQDGKKLYVVDSAGNVYDTNEQVKGKDVKLAIVKDGKVVETVETSLEPKIGYNTFDQRRYEEKGEKYRSTHLGNKVTKINAKRDAELAASEEAKPEAPKVETKVAPEKELSQEEKETFNPLAASLTVEQIEQGKKNKEGCVGVGKKKKEI